MLPPSLIFEENTLCGLLISTLNYDFFQISLQISQGIEATSNPCKIYKHITRGFPTPFIGENLQCTWKHFFLSQYWLQRGVSATGFSLSSQKQSVAPKS